MAMKIIIVGCGKVGSTIAKQLCREGYDITVIDIDRQKLQDISAHDVLTIEGDGSNFKVLQEAGIESANLLIAVTGSDEKNLLSCLIGKRTGELKAIARVRNPEYNSESSFFRKGFGLSLTINPEMAAAKESARNFRFPTATRVEDFAQERAEILTFDLVEDSALVGNPVSYIHSNISSDVLVALVRRGTQTIVPAGDFVLEAGDEVSVFATADRANEFFRQIGLHAVSVKNVIIAGGGTLTYYLAKQLIESGIGVKIVEVNAARCEELSDMLPQAQIINGDASDEELLLEEGIEEVDGFAAMTGIDEINILLSLFVKARSKNGVKLVTKIGRIGFRDVIDSLALGSVINPKEITAEQIVRIARSMGASMTSEMEHLYHLADGEAEAMDFFIHEESPVVGVPLIELQLKPNILIGKIYRDGRLFTPTGSDTMEVGDGVVLLALSKDKITSLEDILA